MVQQCVDLVDLGKCFLNVFSAKIGFDTAESEPSKVCYKAFEGLHTNWIPHSQPRGRRPAVRERGPDPGRGGPFRPSAANPPHSRAFDVSTPHPAEGERSRIVRISGQPRQEHQQQHQNRQQK